MRYVVWHQGRDGSNMLMSILHQIPGAGLSDFEQCGFHVGWASYTEAEFITLCDQYFAHQSTPNGVAGCKAGFSYVDQIAKHSGSFRTAANWVKQFDLHIMLLRTDTAAQAVSTFIATKTKRWRYDSVSDKPFPEFDFEEIAYIEANILGERTKREQFFKSLGIRFMYVIYETLVYDHAYSVKRILDVLNVSCDDIPLPLIQRQLDERKTAYVIKYKQMKSDWS